MDGSGSGQAPGCRLIGFNKIPGLDVYYAADGCFEQGAEPAQFSAIPAVGAVIATSPVRARFAKDAKVLMISEVQQPCSNQALRPPYERFPLLPPGIAQDRRRPADADESRAGFRANSI